MKIELKQLQTHFGTTFVYITHDQSEALVLSDHVAVMNAGRFEQVGTPQELYYQPATPFVAGFVGANNRMAGTAARCRRRDRWKSSPRRDSRCGRGANGAVRAGAAVEAFVRPEVDRPGPRTPASFRRRCSAFDGDVESLLFDGANSAVLVREARPHLEFRIALPQTGHFADLVAGRAHRLRLRACARGLLPRRGVVDGDGCACGARCAGCAACPAGAVAAARAGAALARSGSSCCRTSNWRCCRCARASRRASTNRASPSTGRSSTSRSTGTRSCARRRCRSWRRSCTLVIAFPVAWYIAKIARGRAEVGAASCCA